CGSVPLIAIAFLRCYRAVLEPIIITDCKCQYFSVGVNTNFAFGSAPLSTIAVLSIALRLLKAPITRRPSWEYVPVRPWNLHLEPKYQDESMLVISTEPFESIRLS